MTTIDTAFAILVVIYLWFGSKVDEWITITALGFKLETPHGFLEHPGAYNAIRTVLLLAATGCLLLTQSVPWLVGLATLAAAWFATTWLGQRRAFATYRRVWEEGIADSSTPKDRAFAEAEAKRSNAELRDRFLQHQKLFTR